MQTSYVLDERNSSNYEPWVRIKKYSDKEITHISYLKDKRACY